MIDFNIINDLINGFIPDSLAWLGYTVAGFIYAFMIINLVVMTTALYIWFERRAMARFQSRLGPNRWGPFGLLQPIADVLKLLAKEDVIPAVADKKLFSSFMAWAWPGSFPTKKRFLAIGAKKSWTSLTGF